jgi:hypothetical protein
MTMPYAHLSHEHLQDSVNLLNSLIRCQETVNISPKSKKADNLSIANLL